MFDLPALDTALTGTIFADKLHFAPVTGSTNSDALAAARMGAPHGAVWLADEQSGGRGRGNHGWLSAAGEGLYVSVLLRPEIPVAHLRLLPLCAGLSAAYAIRAVSGVVIDLRWPNDLLVGPRKTGGILVEASTGKGVSAFAVVGIGVNVHQSQFPEGLDTPATSLDLEAGKRIPRQELLVALLQSLERETRALADAGAAEAIPARVEEASTWIRGRRVEVHGAQACTGVTAGLDENGFLRVETETGMITVQAGGIREAV